MQASDIIAELKERHPAWNDPEHVASLRVRGLFALIQQAHEEGVRIGEMRERTITRLKNTVDPAGFGDDFASFLSQHKRGR